jgi:MacB-like periplasmic core domain
MGAWWLLVRTDLRRRWLSVVALSMLIGLAGTFVVTAATGARRTDSALERLLDTTKMWDGSIEVDFPSTDDVAADVAARPEVAAASAAVYIPLSSEQIDTEVIAGLAPGWLRTVYRPRIIAGRLPDPQRVDELLVNEDTARQHHLVPGDTVVLNDDLGLKIAQSMTIVGIHRGVIDLAQGDSSPGALATEAFGRRFATRFYNVVKGSPDADLVRPLIVARAEANVTDPLVALKAVADRHHQARPHVTDRSAFTSPIERALAVQVEAFWILAAVSGLSALFLLGMAVARVAAARTHLDETLRALGLGLTPRTLVVLTVPAIAVTVGCILALAGAAIASPLVPRGSARLVEPDPGIWVDPKTSLVCGLVLAAGLALFAAAFVRVDQRNRRFKPVRAASLLGGSVKATLGRDLAFRRSSWGQLAMMATTVGVGLVVAASVYAPSLDHLVDSPSLFGSAYEVMLFPGDGVDPKDPFADIDLDDRAIESAAIARSAQVDVAGDTVQALVIDPIRGEPGGTVLRGRAPRADDEVALGPTTADNLGLGVGDEMTIAGARKRAMRVVGEAVLPRQGQGAYGDVMWLTPAAARRLEVEPYEPRLLIKPAAGITDGDLVDLIGDAGDPVGIPDDVTNLHGVGQIPVALAIFGALLAAAVLLFALIGIARLRRQDIAILRALGLTPQQVRGSMFAACLLIQVPSAAIGVAAGAVLGRAYWSTVAAGVPAIAQPVVPIALAALVALGTLATSCLLVIGPALLATRIPTAEILQQD